MADTRPPRSIRDGQTVITGKCTCCTKPETTEKQETTEND